MTTGSIDSCVFHEWGSTAALAPYMPKGWREVVLRPGDPGGPINLRSGRLYTNPMGSAPPDRYPPGGGIPASDFDALRAQVLDSGDRKRVVLTYDDGLLMTAIPNYYLARTGVSAANDWTAEEWLARDSRLYGLILALSALPVEAAKEIRRTGANERMVGITMGTNGLDKPFGHPAYYPIYEAASELGLPIVLQVGADNGVNMLTAPVAGGLPSTYAEVRAFGAQPLMSHAANIIVQGVFEIFPDLKVMLVGGGLTWVPSFLWRLDYWYRLSYRQAPWLTRLPSEYFRESMRVTTVSLESPTGSGRLSQALATVPWLGSITVYASGYPESGAEEPAAVLERLPETWSASDVVYRTAFSFFRWPDSATKRGTTAVRNADEIMEAIVDTASAAP